MNPRTELADLVTRTKRLFAAAALLLITFALLVVSSCTLFFTVFVTTFSMGRSLVDRITVRATVDRDATFNVL